MEIWAGVKCFFWYNEWSTGIPFQRKRVLGRFFCEIICFHTQKMEKEDWLGHCVVLTQFFCKIETTAFMLTRIYCMFSTAVFWTVENFERVLWLLIFCTALQAWIMWFWLWNSMPLPNWGHFLHRASGLYAVARKFDFKTLWDLHHILYSLKLKSGELKQILDQIWLRSSICF